MAKLELYLRPLTVFDANKKEHRQLYWNYLATGSWKDCPYRFVVEEDYGNLMGHMQRELLEYYMGREFHGEVKETKILIRQKRKKTVDN